MRGLDLMALHLKGAPIINERRVSDWVRIFYDLSDENFQWLTVEALKRLIFFPTPSEFYGLAERDVGERAEMAFLYAREAFLKSRGERIGKEAVGGDGRILWAMSSVGRTDFEGLFYPDRSEYLDKEVRERFITFYKIAVRYGLEMDSWKNERPPLPKVLPNGFVAQPSKLQIGKLPRGSSGNAKGSLQEYNARGQ